MTTEDTKPPHRLAGINTLELAAGLIIFALGVIVALESLTYPFGTLSNVGPAIFPMLLGCILALLGLTIVIEGRVSMAIAPAIPYRAILAVCASLAAFAFLIDRAGAYVSIFALIFIAGLADRQFRPVTLLFVSLSLCGFITAMIMGFRGIINIDLLPGA